MDGWKQGYVYLRASLGGKPRIRTRTRMRLNVCMPCTTYATSYIPPSLSVCLSVCLPSQVTSHPSTQHLLLHSSRQTRPARQMDGLIK